MGHFYDKSGVSVYEIEAKNGSGLRPTTLADAKKLGLLHSVTTILDVPSKPGLDVWKEDQLLTACIDYQSPPPRRIHDQFEYPGWDEDVKQWKSIIKRQSLIKVKEAAERGSKIHDMIERNLLETQEGLGEEDRVYIEAVRSELIKLGFSLNDCILEHSFGHRDGFGGKIDLYHPDGFIIDFKTKEFDSSKLKTLGYPTHCQQLAAYRKGVGLSNAQCYNLFISVSQPGLTYLKQWSPEELEKAEKMFYHLLEYVKLSTGHDPSW